MAQEGPRIRRWIMQRGRARVGIAFWWDEIPASAKGAQGRYLMNRSRSQEFTPRDRAWADNTYLIEIVVPDDRDGEVDIDALGDLLDATFTVVDAETQADGAIVYSSGRTAEIDYVEKTPSGPDFVHRGGLYRIKLGVP